MLRYKIVEVSLPGMKSIILVILDGWGISREAKGNAIAQARTPTINEIEKFYPAISLQASGIAVGLPWSEAGNSEVGHLTLGAGRVVYQSLLRILLSIQDGSFFKNPALLEAVKNVKAKNSCLHLMGLVSSGTVHSYIDHIYGLIELAKKENVEKVRLHVFTDGEDSPPKEAANFLKNIESKLNELKDGKIATITGRFYAMDRNRNWERTEKTYQCLAEGTGAKYENPIKAVEEFYKKGLTDAFIEPTVIIDSQTKNPLGTIQDNDSVIFFNFREDRVRQLTKAFVMPVFKEFSREQLKNLCFVTITQYEEGSPARVAFLPTKIINHLTEVLSNANKKILKLAETEKYAHVTYFFNGGKETIYPKEERILIPSTTIAHYDRTPEMAANEITEKVIQAVNENKFDFILVNYANTDIVGHTGNFQAVVRAAETVDNCLKSLLELTLEKKCCLLITSDHGNAEEMINLKTGEVVPEHSINPVPFYLVGAEYRDSIKHNLDIRISRPQGIISDVAPTILEIMGIPKPEEMTGQSLLEILK